MTDRETGRSHGLAFAVMQTPRDRRAERASLSRRGYGLAGPAVEPEPLGADVPHADGPAQRVGRRRTSFGSH